MDLTHELHAHEKDVRLRDRRIAETLGEMYPFHVFSGELPAPVDPAPGKLVAGKKAVRHG